jgi:hypothetical protein
MMALADACRAISRDPTMFPDPEAFNPLRWVEPGYPTYQEPLTHFPTIINSTQFGYGRRVCQGQTVADEDLLIGIGSIAWLFNMSRTPQETSDPKGTPNVVADPEKVENLTLGPNLKASISSEELNTGVDLKDNFRKTVEEVLVTKYSYPGSFSTLDDAEDTVTKDTKADVKKVAKTLDPTLDFSTLLIAKPLPFKFHMWPRDTERAKKVRDLFAESAQNGEYSNSREYWGKDQGADKPLGWGKV